MQKNYYKECRGCEAEAKQVRLKREKLRKALILPREFQTSSKLTKILEMYMKMLGTPENIFSVDRSRSNFLNYKIDFFFFMKEQKCFIIS